MLAQTRLEGCQRVGTDSLPHLGNIRLPGSQYLQSGLASQTFLQLCPAPLCPTPTQSSLPPQILSGNCLPQELFSVETGLVVQACDPSYFLGLGSRTESPRPARAPGQPGQVSETLSQSKRWAGDVYLW